MADIDTAFIVQIEEEMKKRGFHRLSIDRAEDATEAITAFIADLEFHGWDGAPLGYGG